MKRETYQIRFDEYKDFEIVSGTCAHSFSAHIHQCLCIGIITKGSVLFTCNNNSSILKTGSFYMIPPYTPHSITTINGKKYSYLTLCIKKTWPVIDFPETISQAKSLIENSEIPLSSVKDLSKQVHMSPFYFNRKFKKHIGISPYQFILSNKIKKIRQGIMSKHPLSDLSLALGFSDQSHLSNTFKKHMGVTPLQFYSAYHCH